MAEDYESICMLKINMHVYLTDSYASSEQLYSLFFPICFKDERNKTAQSIQWLKTHVFSFTLVLFCIWCQLFDIKIQTKIIKTLRYFCSVFAIFSSVTLCCWEVCINKLHFIQFFFFLWRVKYVKWNKRIRIGQETWFEITWDLRLCLM